MLSFFNSTHHLRDIKRKYSLSIILASVSTSISASCLQLLLVGSMYNIAYNDGVRARLNRSIELGCVSRSTRDFSPDYFHFHTFFILQSLAAFISCICYFKDGKSRLSNSLDTILPYGLSALHVALLTLHLWPVRIEAFPNGYCYGFCSSYGYEVKCSDKIVNNIDQGTFQMPAFFWPLFVSSTILAAVAWTSASILKKKINHYQAPTGGRSDTAEQQGDGRASVSAFR